MIRREDRQTQLGPAPAPRTGRELGMSDRVIDAIQGHARRTEGDNYGDITVTAKVKVIEALAYYDLS